MMRRIHAAADVLCSIETLRAAIAASREQRLAHPIYEAVDTRGRRGQRLLDDLLEC